MVYYLSTPSRKMSMSTENIYSKNGLMYSVGLPVLLTAIIAIIVYMKKPSAYFSQDASGNQVLNVKSFVILVVGLLAAFMLVAWLWMSQMMQ